MVQLATGSMSIAMVDYSECFKYQVAVIYYPGFPSNDKKWKYAENE